ncbi:MAG: hypothetical protein RLZZ247_931 [Cyanobacteriota bacterium]|jgi:hypothetical protein
MKFRQTSAVALGALILGASVTGAAIGSRAATPTKALGAIDCSRQDLLCVAYTFNLRTNQKTDSVAYQFGYPGLQSVLAPLKYANGQPVDGRAWQSYLNIDFARRPYLCAKIETDGNSNPLRVSSIKLTGNSLLTSAPRAGQPRTCPSL